VFDENFERVVESPAVTATEWQPYRPLARGRIYNWQVTATIAGKTIHAPTPPAPEARFQVVAQESADRIEMARREHPTNHVLLAALYAKAGDVVNAGKELDQLAATDPPTAAALRQSLKQTWHRHSCRTLSGSSGGSCLRMAVMVSTDVSPTKARLPESSPYRMRRS
jgi:hypothetical protein